MLNFVTQITNTLIMASGGENYGSKGTALMWIFIAFILFIILIVYIFKMNLVNVNPVG